MPPSAGKIIAWSTVWLALNEQMWVTMSLSPGATTAWGGGRSWIWNNETVNGRHHWYWFFSRASVYVLCPWSSTDAVAAHTLRRAALIGTMHVAEKEKKEKGHKDGRPAPSTVNPLNPYPTLSCAVWTDFIKLCSFNMKFHRMGVKGFTESW